MYASALHERPIAEDRLTVTASGMNAIMLVMQLVVEPGDNVVIGTPIWPNCVETVHVMGGAVREVPLVLADGRWRCDMDRLVDAFDERTRAIFINSPGNPTGWVMPAAQQRELLEVCRERRIVIVADEVYERLAYEAPRAPSFLDIAAPDDPVIVVNSFSKSWSMTGWRLGWLTHPADVGDRLAMLNEYNIAAPTTFVQHAGIAALQQGEPFVGELVERYRRNRDLVYQQLAAWPRLRLARPEGAFYAFFAVDGVTDSTALARRILDETAVGLAPGAAFGPAGEGFLRLCFARQRHAFPGTGAIGPGIALATGDGRVLWSGHPTGVILGPEPLLSGLDRDVRSAGDGSMPDRDTWPGARLGTAHDQNPLARGSSPPSSLSRA